jgi:hypothetical protein
MTAPEVARDRGNAIEAVFGRAKAVIGVVHLLPLPGSPHHEGLAATAIYDRAMADARAYAAGGVDGLIVENHGDIPFSKPEDIGPETAAFMAIVTDRVRRECKLPVGINVLANAALPALAVAAAADGAFIRVNQWANAYVANEGFIEGAAAKALRFRARLRAAGIRIFADVHVKHGAHAIVADRPLEELVRDVAFFDADVMIATGQRTGHAADLDYIRTIRSAAPLPLLVGSGVNNDNVNELLQVTDGVIVASALKQDGVWWNPVDADRVKRFVQGIRR